MQLISKQRNPMIDNLMRMDAVSLENFARNFCKENGKDFDKEFNAFMNSVR
jgi:hypothetical protein